MDAEYQWRLTAPGPRLAVFLANRAKDRRFLDVTMVLRRVELSRSTMVRSLVRHPWMTARVSQAIYWQALRLWLKKCPFYPHPAHRDPQETTRP
jgi:hypothetical protein